MHTAVTGNQFVDILVIKWLAVSRAQIIMVIQGARNMHQPLICALQHATKHYLCLLLEFVVAKAVEKSRWMSRQQQPWSSLMWDMDRDSIEEPCSARHVSASLF